MTSKSKGVLAIPIGRRHFTVPLIDENASLCRGEASFLSANTNEVVAREWIFTLCLGHGMRSGFTPLNYPVCVFFSLCSRGKRSKIGAILYRPCQENFACFQISRHENDPAAVKNTLLIVRVQNISCQGESKVIRRATMPSPLCSCSSPKSREVRPSARLYNLPR